MPPVTPTNTGAEGTLDGRVSFSRCAPSDPTSPVPRSAQSAGGPGSAGAESGVAPSNSSCGTPLKKTPAKYPPYHSSHNSAVKAVHNPIQATDLNHYAVHPHSPVNASSPSPFRKDHGQTPGAAALSPVTPERRASTRQDSDGYDSAGEAESDPSSILERIYSPTGAGQASAAHRRTPSTSHVYSVNSAGQMTAKAASTGSRTPSHRSRATSAAGSVAGGELLCRADGGLVFESSVEEECAHRRVAYIAVQFSSIKETNG
jgi:hypothetical protein